ncbi:MAG: hypothetical protein ACPGYP_02095 [Solirubrobacterales bacterium]
MKTISVAVTEKHYEFLREQAKSQNRSIASLIREGMSEHVARLSQRKTDIDIGETDGETVVVKQLLPGPGRYQIYAEVAEAEPRK